MNKTRQPTPRNTAGFNDEINVENYPYYRFIPIEHIGDQQRKMIDRYRIAQKVNEPYYTYETPQTLAVLDLVPPAVTTAVPDTYQVDFKNFEDKLDKMRRTVSTNGYTIEQQLDEIERNKRIIEEQTKQIQSQAATIQNNGVYIQQQIHCYSHNTSVINNQCYYVQQQNAEIVSKQEQISTLEGQVVDLNQEITNLQADIESYQSQLNYHTSMLSSFNTLLQNPQYFSQLMVAAMNSSQIPTE
jgi:hypothetical protein